MNIDQLDAMVHEMIKPRKIRLNWHGDFRIHTIFDKMTGQYETAVIHDDTQSVFLLYIGNSKLAAIWKHWRANRKWKAGDYIMDVLADNTKKVEGVPGYMMKVHAPESMDIMRAVQKKGKKKSKGEKVINFDDLK